MRFLSTLGLVLVRPRQAMRQILDGGDRKVLLMLTLAAGSGMFGDLDAPTFRELLQRDDMTQVALVVAGVVVLVLALTVGLLALYAYVPLFAGRFLGGTGSLRDTRAAMAWGFAPAVWALLYRVPVAILYGGSGVAPEVRAGRWRAGFDPGMLADGCAMAALFALLELVIFIWCAVVMSHTLAEAHGFSALRGLGTIAISAIVPFVVVVAAVLSFL